MAIKNKKAEMKMLLRIVLWIAVFVILAVGLYFLVKTMTNP